MNKQSFAPTVTQREPDAESVVNRADQISSVMVTTILKPLLCGHLGIGNSGSGILRIDRQYNSAWLTPAGGRVSKWNCLR